MEDLGVGLYLVATPIGNLEDITYRAAEVLKSVDLILAEDTRHSRILLDRIGSRVHVESYNDFNKEKKADHYISILKEGKKIALISDAGTPGIADPGFCLVRKAREAGLDVCALPGACALTTALSASGLPTDRFLFANFPPPKSHARRLMLNELKAQYGPEHKHNPTFGFYVSPHKLISFVEDIRDVFGPETRLVLGRELTKKFEEYLSQTAAEVLEYYRERKPRGEYVLLFHPDNKG